MGAIKECACCGKKIKIDCLVAEWEWQLDKKYYCSNTCYSKAFYSKYKPFKKTCESKIGYKTDKTLR